MILLQLLRKKSHTLRNEKQYAELCSELHTLQRYNNQAKERIDEDDRISAIQKVALRVISFFDDSETVSIIIDRGDRCRDWEESDHRKELVKVLVQMVEAARCKLKILAVIHGQSWPVE